MLTITYDTTGELLEKIPAMIKDIIGSHKHITFDRAHLMQLASSSINYEVVYFVETNDLAYHMDTQQAIYISIIKAFRQKGIDFAFPSQTVYESKKQQA